MLKKNFKKTIASIIVTLLFITLVFMILVPPAAAVKLNPGSSSTTSVCNESSITFADVNLTIRAEERIPVNFLNFSIYNNETDQCVAYVTFYIDGTEIIDSPSGKFTVTKTTEILDSWYSYGYGYGTDEELSQNYNFGYGYGYGYYSSSFTDITVLYNITYITHTNGAFYAKLTVNSTSHSYVSAESTAFTVYNVPWDGNDVSATKAEEVSGSGTVNAIDEANVTIEVTGSGSTVVMVANYTDNPGSEGLSSSGFFFDTHIPNVSNATSITVKYWVASTPSSNYQCLYYWNATTSSWKICSNTGYTADDSIGSPYVGYNYATITGATQPRLSDLIGLPFFGGEPLTIALDSLSKTYYKSGDQLNISGYLLPALNGQQIGIEVNDSAGNQIFPDQVSTNVSGEFSTNTYLGGVSTSDGTATIYASISGTSTSVNQTFVYDATDPTASIDTISSYTNTAPYISGSSSDGIALQYVSVRLNYTNGGTTSYWDFDADEWTSTETWEQVTQSGTTTTWNLSSVAPVVANYSSNQLYTVSAYAVDQAGNDGAVATETFTFDAIAPTSSISSPSDNAKLNALTEISGNASDGTSVSGVELQIINSSNYYWNGTTWTSAVSWLSASGTTTWTYDSSSVTWSSCGENAVFTLKTRATDTSGNIETPDSGTGWTFGITANIEPMETTYRGGAYHGARVNWTNVGTPTYKLYASLSDITSVTDSGVSAVATVSSTNTSSFSNLSSSMWGHEVYYAVTTVDGNGVEAPSTFIGTTNHTKCWAYKMEICQPSITASTTQFDWDFDYSSRFLGGSIEDWYVICEFLGPNATGAESIPNRPVLITANKIPGDLTFLEASESDSLGTYAGGAVTQNYKGWFMLWSCLPSQGGYWEAYADKYIESPIVIS